MGVNSPANNDAMPGRRVVRIIHQAVNQRLPAVLCGGEVDQLTLVLGAEGTGDGQDVDRLDKGRFPLCVLPEIDRDARWHFQLHLGQITEVGEAKMG